MSKDVNFLTERAAKRILPEHENASRLCIPESKVEMLKALSYNSMIIRGLQNQVLFC